MGIDQSSRIPIMYMHEEPSHFMLVTVCVVVGLRVCVCVCCVCVCVCCVRVCVCVCVVCVKSSQHTVLASSVV